MDGNNPNNLSPGGVPAPTPLTPPATPTPVTQTPQPTQPPSAPNLAPTTSAPAPATIPPKAPEPVPATTPQKNHEPPTPPEQSKTPEQPTSNEPPKITGISSSLNAASTATDEKKKELTPSERSEKIIKDAEEAKKKEQEKLEAERIKQEKIAKRQVTQEEIDAYRDKLRKKHLAISGAGILLIGAIIVISAVAIISKINSEREHKSGVYANNLPLIVHKESTYQIVSTDGKELSEEYRKIQPYYNNFAIANSQAKNSEQTDSESQDVQPQGVKYYILNAKGEANYETSNRITYGKNNFIEQQDRELKIIDNTGNSKTNHKISAYVNNTNEKPEFLFFQDKDRYGIVNTDGEDTLSVKLSNNESVENFDIAYDRFDKNTYCVIGTRKLNKNQKKTEVTESEENPDEEAEIIEQDEIQTEVAIYNCATGNLVKRLENSTDATFVDETYLITNDGSYYVHNDHLLYSSTTKDILIGAGVIERSNPETGETEYFNPIDKDFNQKMPDINLYNQQDFDVKTSVNSPDCNNTRSAIYSETNTAQICNHIYKDNKLLELNYSKYIYQLLDEDLDRYLEYRGHQYILQTERGSGRSSLYDLHKKEVVEETNNKVTLNNDVNNMSNIFPLISDDEENLETDSDKITKQFFDGSDAKVFEIEIPRNYSYETHINYLEITEKGTCKSEDCNSFDVISRKYYDNKGKLIYEWYK